MSTAIRINAYTLVAAGWAIAVLGVTGCTTQVQSEPPTTIPIEESAIEESSPAQSQAEMVSANPNPDFQSVTVVDNLEHPWGLTWLPDGSILITERSGQLRIVRDGLLDPTPIAGVPEVFAQNQGGLLDIALHPGFAENRLVYFTYAHGTSSANRTRIARATFDGSSLSNWQVIFEVSQTKPRGQHFGSRLLWLPDGTLLASIGDGGNPPVELEGQFIRQQAQNLGSHLGKIIRINDDGSIPSDNPFVNNPNAAPEVWSYGHRNIQGLALDAIANRVWVTEHGARGGDEVNWVEAGDNYGWPVATHSREYSGGLISPETSLPGMVDPKVIWTPSIAPSGLAVYGGMLFPEWQGNLFAGGLVSQDIRRIELDESGNVLNEESIAIGQRVRDVREGPDGMLYVLTDASNGQLIRLEPVDRSLLQPAILSTITP
ncbi:MAG: PQQ-dependent sugar dehydrogenase [Roseofilum sp. SBFL]|nr:MULTISPECIES: PQQ-dependent sugar dehydrogenase [unclassified Roseofilum]MBP0023536.1 PQQ-dependent sugar dehydrogenase [Roseofilum sp. SID2]MBP0039636.1 PQQ-dependent sugar dehydrogenase [Roseofilum sp. SID1]MBP0043563.1 PQQ-dependent sugar dehydrogenase [Roseofilum sp. SBFL]